MRGKRTLVWSAVLLFSTGLVLIILSPWLAKQQPKPVLELPVAEQVMEMRASMPAIWTSNAVPEFVVPQEHVPNILFWLNPGKYAGNSFSREVDSGFYDKVAEIVIRTKAGEELRLRCYDWGCNPVVFTANGKDFFLGHSGDENGNHVEGCIDGGAMLYLAIEAAYKAKNK
jgi:hypothetical protein